YYEQHPGQPSGGPILIELIRRRFPRQRTWRWRRLAKPANIPAEMILVERHGIVLITFVKIPRYENRCIQKHRTSPEFREELALDAEMADVFRILRWIDRRNHVRQGQSHLRGRIHFHLLRLAVQITRRAIPLLAFTVIRMEFQDVAVRPLERLINI